MSAGQAEYIVKDTLAGGRLVSVTNDSYYRTSDAKLRPDGVGFLWIRARDPGGTKPLVYDSPPQFKACYFAQASSPQVIHYSLNKLLAVRGLCEVEVWFGTLDEAKQFADALFVLRQRQR